MALLIGPSASPVIKTQKSKCVRLPTQSIDTLSVIKDWFACPTITRVCMPTNALIANQHLVAHTLVCAGCFGECCAFGYDSESAESETVLTAQKEPKCTTHKTCGRPYFEHHPNCNCSACDVLQRWVCDVRVRAGAWACGRMRALACTRVV